MLKIDRENRAFEQILNKTLKEAGLKERADLQDWIAGDPKAFFDEIGLGNAVLLGKELKPSGDLVGDRIDLLALDKDGAVIVIELKRGTNKLLLLQGISYAAMIAKWKPEQFRELNQNRDPELEDGAMINSKQRIVLVADAFEYEVLRTAEWLVEEYDLDIRCILLKVASDPRSDAEYLTCEQVCPALEIEERVSPRRRNRGESPLPSPAEIQKTTDNDEVSAFFEEQRATRSPAEARTQVRFDEKNKTLGYWVGRKEWQVGIRKRYAAVWQYHRFSGDLEFWRQGLSKPETVEEKDDRRAMSFHLESRADFDKFLDAFNKASTFEWQSTPRGR
jgi:hypothetical protein